MRVASRLLLTPSPCICRSRTTLLRRVEPLLQYRAAHNPSQPGPSSSWDFNETQRAAHIPAQAASSPIWTLADLSQLALSEQTGPFVFHLTSDDPYLNLSIEHFLFSKFKPKSRILLFYTNRPSVVIGRNQNPWLEVDLKKIQGGLQSEEEALQTSKGKSPLALGTNKRNIHDETVSVDLVRRRSGGGTVFHDGGNLNFSVIIPHNGDFTRAKHAEMVAQSLQSLKSPAADRWSLSPGQPYILPEIRVNDRYDLAMRRPNESEWLKLSGSAFKLSRVRALHHGTLLYSSPYLNLISDLLRSPGRDFIFSKGVVSVRSKVGNLAWTTKQSLRDTIRKDITEAIVQRFWDMYGVDQPRVAGVNEITLNPIQSFGELEVQNPFIASGVQELRSPAWIFSETPRFDFKSGMLENHELTFYARGGNILNLELRAPVAGSEKDPGGLRWRYLKRSIGNEDQNVGSRYSEEAVSLTNIRDWQGLLDQDIDREQRQRRRTLDLGMHAPDYRERMDAKLPDVLCRRLEAVFPPCIVRDPEGVQATASSNKNRQAAWEAAQRPHDISLPVSDL